MMNTLPYTVIADDLTGACEIAAIFHSPSRRTMVSMDVDGQSPPVDLLVYDTETRLDSPEDAARKIQSIAGKLLDQRAGRLVFKKIDSVMRGPVSAEIGVLIRRLGYNRVIMVPANPELGRTVRKGVYRINERLLAETPFAEDLHHPAQSSRVTDLLGTFPELPVVSCSPGDPLPQEGLIIGDASSREDLEKWINQWNNTTLLAGSSGLFEALVHKLGPNSLDKNTIQPIPGRHLLVSGTIHSGQQAFLDDLQDKGWPQVKGYTGEAENSASQVWCTAINEILQTHTNCVLRMAPEATPDPSKAAWVRVHLAKAAKQAVQSGKARHLIVEGGATAASIAEQLGWKSFFVHQVWDRGVVTLKPHSTEDCLFTIKPGSYPWPDNFFTRLGHNGIKTA